MSKHAHHGLRIVALVTLVTVMLALAACTGIPGLPTNPPTNTPSSGGGQATSVAKAAVPKAAATTAPAAATQPSQAAPKAAATAVTQPTLATAATAVAQPTLATAAGAAGAATAAVPRATPGTGAAAAGAATAVVPRATPSAGATAGVAPTAAVPQAGALPAAPTGTAAQRLEGPVWKLQSYTNSAGQTTNVLPNSNVTAEFNAGRLNGTAGCNTYFASYKAEGNKLTISEAGSTMMACPDQAVMAQESAYLQTLSKAATYQISGDTLAISDASGKVILTFKATPAPTLSSNPWSLVSYNNGKQAVVGLQPGSEITAVFSADGKVSGSGGCNTYSGSYTVDGNKIKVGPLASTRKACAQPIMDQEAAYLKALESAATWSISNGQLRMRTADDAQAVNYAATVAASVPGSSWKLTGINNGRGGLESVPTGVEATVTFGTDGRATGSGGCNTFNVPYTVEGGNIKFGVGITTQKACPEPQMQVEVWFLRALETTTKWSIDNGALVLRDANGAMTATFAPAK